MFERNSFNTVTNRSWKQHPPESTSGAGWHWRQRRKSRIESQREYGTAASAVRSPKMARLEAALFVADRALSPKKLVQMATLSDHHEAGELIEQLNELYDAGESSFRIEQVAAGYKLLTRPEFATWLDRLHQRQAEMKLSPPAMETLSVIAYRQPCTRADIETVRGVRCSEMIKQLMDRNLIRVVGEDDSLGRPFLYGTTRLFLETFGLSNLKSLPMADVLKPIEHSIQEDHAEADDGAEDSATESETVSGKEVSFDDDVEFDDEDIDSMLDELDDEDDD